MNFQKEIINNLIDMNHYFTRLFNDLVIEQHIKRQNIRNSLSDPTKGKCIRIY